MEEIKIPLNLSAKAFKNISASYPTMRKCIFPLLVSHTQVIEVEVLCTSN